MTHGLLRKHITRHLMGWTEFPFPAGSDGNDPERILSDPVVALASSLTWS